MKQEFSILFVYLLLLGFPYLSFFLLKKFKASAIQSFLLLLFSLVYAGFLSFSILWAFLPPLKDFSKPVVLQKIFTDKNASLYYGDVSNGS